jgi:hypothetical protein
MLNSTARGKFSVSTKEGKTTETNTRTEDEKTSKKKSRIG